MRDPERIPEMMALVSALWNRYPEWRLAQLVENAHAAAGVPGEAYFAEDEVLVRLAKATRRAAGWWGRRAGSNGGIARPLRRWLNR